MNRETNECPRMDELPEGRTIAAMDPLSTAVASLDEIVALYQAAQIMALQEAAAICAGYADTEMSPEGLAVELLTMARDAEPDGKELDLQWDPDLARRVDAWMVAEDQAVRDDPGHKECPWHNAAWHQSRGVDSSVDATGFRWTIRCMAFDCDTEVLYAGTQREAWAKWDDRGSKLKKESADPTPEDEPGHGSTPMPADLRQGGVRGG